MLNVLDYRVSDNHGRSFELVIDRLPFGQLIDEDWPIPFWYFFEHTFDDGLPGFWPDRPSERLVAVCDCGEAGCGSVHCTVDEVDGQVIFSNFSGPAHELGEFAFSPENYKSVVSEIVERANLYHASHDS